MPIALRIGTDGRLQNFQAGEALLVDEIDRLGTGGLIIGASLGAPDTLTLGTVAALTNILGDLDVDGIVTAPGLLLEGQASNPLAPGANNGTLWVQTGSPSLPMFTDSGDVDYILNSFLGNSDTPSSFAGLGNHALIVNPGATAVTTTPGGQTIAADTTTGVLDGGLLTAGSNGDEVSVSDGDGRIVGYGTPNIPAIADRPWSGITDVAITAIATTQITFLFITPGGTLLQLSGVLPTEAQKRANIYLGYVTHFDNATIDSFISKPALAYGAGQDFKILIDKLSGVLLSGSLIGPNGANLSLDVSNGEYFDEGINFHTSKTNPSVKAFLGATAFLFGRIYGDGTQGGETFRESITTFVDPTNYDNGGSLVSTGGANTASIQRVYLDPLGNRWVAYGQESFNRYDDAVSNMGSEFFLETAFMRTCRLLARIAVRNSASALDDTDNAFIVNEDSGQVGGITSGETADALLAHTGWLDGLVLSVNGGDDATFDLSLGSGRVANHSSPTLPLVTDVPYLGGTAIPIPLIGTTNATAVGLNVAGTVVLFPNAIVTDEDYRTHIMVGTLVHENFTNINLVFTSPAQAAYDGVLSFSDFIRRVTGPCNAGGNVFSANGANLSIDKSAGSSLVLGSNARITPEVPDLHPDSQQILASFQKVYRSAITGILSIDGGDVTVINPNQYDPNGDGSLVAMPNNDFQVMVEYYTPNNEAIFVAYGQEAFNTLDDAFSALKNGILEYEEYAQLKGLLLRGWLIVQDGATSLVNTLDARFIEAPSFRISGISGSAGGGADANAIHVNVANEISGIAEKTSIVAADLIIIEDSEDGFNKKKVTAAAARRQFTHPVFALTENTENTDRFFHYSRSAGGDTPDPKRSGNNGGIQNQNSCSPYPVPFKCNIVSVSMVLKGAGVQNGSVVYPVAYQLEVHSIGFTGTTILGVIDFDITNSFTVGIFSVAATDMNAQQDYSPGLALEEDTLIGVKFINTPSGPSIVSQSRNCFITFTLREDLT